MSTAIKSATRPTTTDDWQAGGSLLDTALRLHSDGHIGDRLLAAGGRLVRDMTVCHGTSAGMVGQYDGPTGRSDPHTRLPVRSGAYEAFARMQRVLDALRPHEKDLLRFLVCSRDLERGSLADWGRQTSAYQSKPTQIASAAGQVRCLLETIDGVG